MKRSIVWGIFFLGTINFRIFGMSSVGYESAYNIAETREMERQAAIQRQQEEKSARAGTVGAYGTYYSERRPDFSGSEARRIRDEERALQEERTEAYKHPWKRVYTHPGERAIEHAEARRAYGEELMGAYREGQLREAPEFVRPVQEVERPSEEKLRAMRREEAAVKAKKELVYERAASTQDPVYAEIMARLAETISQTERHLAYSEAYLAGEPAYREKAERKEQAAIRAARKERELAYYGGSRSNLQAIRDYTNDMWRYISTSNVAGEVKARALAALARADKMFKQAWEEAGKQTAEAKRKANELIVAGLDSLRRFKSYMPQAQAQVQAQVRGEGFYAFESQVPAVQVMNYRALVKQYGQRNKMSREELQQTRDNFARLHHALRDSTNPALNQEVTNQIVPFLVRKLAGTTALDYVESYVKKLDADLAKLNMRMGSQSGSFSSSMQ